MARKIIDIGTIGNDGTGDSIRDSFRKVNDNFRELYSSLGLGEKLSFIGLDDTPATYVGQNDSATNATPVLTVNNTESGITFKQLRAGNGISIDFATNPNEITINADFAEISADSTPQLGGNLSARSGGNQYRIYDLGTNTTPLTPIYSHEAVNKAYADTKIALAGVNAINPATGNVDPSFGRMGGPLILARDPEPDDDELYGGMIAATKRYVDNAAFGSSVNLYVALSGQDDRPGVSKSLQGRALAYAYRTLEAALKRAEELVLEAREEIGPYKKVLTYNNGQGECALTSITPSPTSGTGFAGAIKMSVDTVVLNSVGTNYFPGDILSLSGGSIPTGGGACTIEVLTTLTTPGAISTYRIISSGSYSALPGNTNVATTISTSAAPPGIGAVGAGATFDVTYKVNSVAITNKGSGYSLVSVRITGGGGTGAFGTAVVDGGKIESITITDKGAGFTSLPTLSVDLPRFAIYTAGYRTDYTGDVTTTTPEAIRGRDIREGLYLRGENTGALAQILSHSGELDSFGNELFDVDIKYGTFEIGEPIAYGDISKNIQISVLVESGEYYENYPLKVPTNVSIVGDEFRRVIFRPKPGTSSSPWAFQKFRRDLVIDGLTVTESTSEFGYHYLQNSDAPIYPKISNPGNYTSAAALLELNRSFIQEELIAWMNYNIKNNVSPFVGFDYNENLCKRDAGLIIDSIIFDIKYGGYNRTISAGLKYFESASARIAITTQLTQYREVLDKLNSLMQSVISNSAISPVRQTLYYQIIDPAYSSEIGSDTVISTLLTVLEDVIDGSGSVNYPKENQEMDVFLANDAVRWQAISAIGHGGFMGVLDPEGQILSRSPYFQECASFSRSKDRHVFAGGMFVDGFAGNLQFTMLTIVSPTRIEVGGLDRFPQLPCSFIVDDTVYRVNYIRDFVYNKDGSTATFILDETTPWPFDLFSYNRDACYRDAGLIIDGLGYDIVFQTNFNQRKASLTYTQANAAAVLRDQRAITIRAINLAHDLSANKLTGYTVPLETVSDSKGTFEDVIDRGVVGAPAITFTLPPGLSTNLTNAYRLLFDNYNYIVSETTGWIAAQIAGNVSPFTSSFTYNISKCERDTQYILEAVTYDLIYGGNSATRDAGLKYYDGILDTSTLQIPSGQISQSAAAVNYTKYLVKQVIQNLAPAVSYSALSRVTGTAASAAEAATVETLMAGIATTITGGVGSAPALVLPDLNAYAYPASYKTARSLLVSEKLNIQNAVVDYVDTTGNQYELLMPGNRSMLANDHTQINDMGYGAIAANGGLIELVSVFTYYCYISYYSVRGGQIRSVSGSSSHGVYALVAEGYDPLEVPTPTTLFEDLAQKVKCYYPTPTYQNTLGGLFIYVHAYDYQPYGSSELEIDHGGVIFRYPVTSVTVEDSFPPGVARLNLTTGTGAAETEGLFAVVPDNTVMTLRQNGQVLLTNALGDVAVRPSTGLKLRETSDVVYRVLQFASAIDTNGPYEVQISNGSPAVFKMLATITTILNNVCTTSQNHKLRLGDKFIPTSTANGLISSTTYYVVDVPEYNQFKLSTSVGGAEITLVNGSGLSIKGVKTHKLLENYLVSFNPAKVLATNLVAGHTYTIVETNDTNFTLVGSVSNSVGVTFTATGPGTGSGVVNDLSYDLPNPIIDDLTYYVVPTDLTDTEFTISTQRNGEPLNTTSAGVGEFTLTHEGLTKTTLRENYDYLEYTMWQPGETAYYDVVATNTTTGTNLITLSTISYQIRPGMPIVFAGTGFGGISAGTTYYVKSSPYSANIPVATVARSGTLATIVTSVNHGLATGQVVNINSTGTALDSDNAVTITVVDGTTFTYTSGVSGAIGTTPAVNGRVVPDAKITISATLGGSAVTLSTATGLMSAVAGGPVAATVSIASPAVVTCNNHGFVADEVFKFETNGNLPSGLSALANYHVLSDGLTANTFKFSATPGGTPIDTSGTQSGTHTITRVSGREGDQKYAIVAVATDQRPRVVGSKFMWKGEEYIVTRYDSEEVTNKAYGRLYINRPLRDSLISYSSSYTAKGAVPIRGSGSLGNLTIRISLTRVTSHDLLEIGTGSYADTNYPKEIYGGSVNPINEDTETEERDVGRCFYVTTDQYGNFKVGPYFKVDQGTGTVTFSASIALSNLDGIGFKRGVPVSEFSTDSGFTDNATDTVPTENATRIYIERRLGVSHEGSSVPEGQLIPSVTGGFMALSGQLAMKGDMDINNHRIVNVSNPTTAQDAVNLRSLTLSNFQDWAGGNIDAADFMVFSGVGNTLINASVIGDVTVQLRTGVDSTLNQLDVQLVPGTIVDTDINSSAAIAQSKLSMTAASTRANATGITQADRGLASFDSARFTVTDGWVTLKDNGTTLDELQQISSKKVLGNAALNTANVAEVDFSTVVNDGGAVKKSQYSSTGFLRRTTSGSFSSDGDYTVVEAASGTAAAPQASKIVIRDANGDFGARIVDVSQLKVDNNISIDSATTATGGYIRYHGWNSAGGIYVQSGSLAADKTTYYDNDAHQFRTQNGVSLAPVTASSIQVTAITTGGTTTPGTITGRWTLTGTSPNESRLQATYSADLAENYEGDKEYEVGTVLVFGGDKEVTTTNIKNDTRVAGVVSDTAAYTMYEACPGFKNLVALQGRVPCKVVGKIKKGDILVTSGIPGVATAAVGDVKVGTVVGKALYDYDSDHIGTLEIAVGRT